MEYNWCEYYRKAYENKKRENTVLAGKAADAEAKREELQAKYDMLCANPLYKASKVPSFLKRGLRRALNIPKKLCPDGLCGTGKMAAKPEALSAAYRERLESQSDRYGRWMIEEEPVLWERCAADLARRKLEAGAADAASAGGRRKCLVIPYGELKGIMDLRRITGEREAALSADGQAGEARADILLFAERAEDLDKRAIFYIEEFFGAYPNTKLLYGAEDMRVGEKRCFPWFKPCFSPDTLLGFFYFGSFFAVDRGWAERQPLSGYADERQNLYDFVLNLVKPYFAKPYSVQFDKERQWRTGGIYTCAAPSPEVVCTDLVLYHREGESLLEIEPGRDYILRAGEVGAADHPEFWGYGREYIKLKQDFINNREQDSFVCQTFHPDVWSVVPKTIAAEGGVLLSVIIPSKDHPELLEKCIGSFIERTYLPGLLETVEFIVVDNGSGDENRQRIEAYLDSLDIACHYLYQPMDFNFSAMCNMGVRRAKGEYILLLNDDIEVVERNWLRILLGQAYLPGVGAVGAKLWYPEEEKIQHAGVTNMHVGPSHKLTTFPDDRNYYYGRNTVSYDMAAVTAACLLVRRDLYEEAGGLDESMAVAYNDVDFCFTLLRQGYRNVLRNDAVLLHHESASRGLDGESEEKWARLLGEKERLYKKHPLFLEYDPYYSDQLAGFALEYRIGYRYPYERPFLTAAPERREGKAELEKLISGAVMLTLEQTADKRKLHPEEPAILEAEGWCYMLGEDNALFERWLVLEAEHGDFYYRFPVKERRRPDVEAILPLQKNIELSGFTCRIVKGEIASGKYQAGMLYRNLCNGKAAYQRATREIEV